MVIDQFGSVGIGIATPGAKLDVNGGTLVGVRSNSPTDTAFYGSTTSGTGVYGLSTTSGDGVHGESVSGRAVSGVSPSGFAGLFQGKVYMSGNVGIGTTSPGARLTVAGSGLFNSSSAARFDLLNTTSGFGFLQNVTDTGLWQIATTAGSTRMVINPTGNVGIGTATPAAQLQIAGTGTNGFTLGVEGNVTQNLSSGGFAKAMIVLNANGTMARCFNGITGSSTGNCGFTIFHPGPGDYNIDFGFQVFDRFATVTARFQGTLSYGPSANFIQVYTYTLNGSSIDSVLTIIVY
jgi:hypothetical protein